LIIDQFTKQAIPFTQNAAHSAEYAIKQFVTLSKVSKKDTVLDVACGSGLVSCGYLKVSPIYVSTTVRNAKRLQLLADDILDVTKIEGQSLQLKKELINVNDIISNTVEKIKNQMGHDENVELVSNSLDHNIVFVEADKAIPIC
jgi:signal transduction histidine kinase